jgi:hypothetical protein
VKVGDLIMDHDIGMSGIIVELLPNHKHRKRPELGDQPLDHFRVLYQDGHLELINYEDKVVVINESR